MREQGRKVGSAVATSVFHQLLTLSVLHLDREVSAAIRRALDSTIYQWAHGEELAVALVHQENRALRPSLHDLEAPGPDLLRHFRCFPPIRANAWRQLEDETLLDLAQSVLHDVVCDRATRGVGSWFSQAMPGAERLPCRSSLLTLEARHVPLFLRCRDAPGSSPLFPAVSLSSSSRESRGRMIDNDRSTR